MKRSFTIGKRRPNKTVKSGRQSGWNGGTARRIALKCRIRNGLRVFADKPRRGRARHAISTRSEVQKTSNLEPSSVPHVLPVSRGYAVPCEGEKSCVIFCESALSPHCLYSAR